MADDLQRVGLVFKADGAVDFQKSLKEINSSVQENRSEFQLAKAAWDDSTSSLDKLGDRQEYLTKQTGVYSEKVDILKKEIQELENAETKDEKALQKKKTQLTSTQATLINYQKGLKDVTNQIESGSAAMQEEMKALDGTISTLDSKVKENESAFQNLKSQWDENTKTSKKLRDEQGYLADQSDAYTKKVDSLADQLKLLENAEERNEKAISDKKTELNNTTREMNSYKDSLSDVEKKLKTGSYKLKEYSDGLETAGNKAKSAGEKLSGVSTASAGLLTAMAATVPATAEYRKIMSSLDISSELSGYTAEQTAQSYKQLYGVLADDQTAATTTANLQGLGLSQSDLTEMINGTIGAWAKYGDSIPIDGLAESINETARTAAVTGTFADVLNWAGASEDAFNEKLEAAGSTSERTNLIMQELSRQGLTEAGQKWQDNNRTLVEGNQATADMQEATAELAETMAPLVTKVTELVTELLKGFNALPEETQATILGVLGFIAILAPLLSGIGSITLGFGGVVKGLGAIGTGATGLFGIIASHPVIAIITVIIGAVILLYNKCEWFRDGVNTIFGKIGGALETLSENTKENLSRMQDAYEENGGGIKGFIAAWWEGLDGLTGGKLGEAVDTVRSKLEDIKNAFFEKMGLSKDEVEAAVKSIKGFFDFKWKLPELKMPHFNIKGGFSLSPLSVPSIGVKWYAKGGILNSPTIFGQGADGNLLGGGEAGKEAVLPIDLLRKYIAEENAKSNATLVASIKEAFEGIAIYNDNSVSIGDRKFYDIVSDNVTKRIDRKEKDKFGLRGSFA